MKKSSLALGLTLCCAMVLGVAGCSGQATRGTVEDETTGVTVAATTTSTAGPESTAAATTTTTVAATTTTTAVAPENAIEVEEYAVYSALIQTMYIDAGTSMGGGKPELIVIEGQTALGPISPVNETVDAMRYAWPDLAAGIFTDFEAKSERPQALEPLLSLSVEYVFFSDQEMEDIFSNNGSGWDDFYDKYPDSQGILTLSRVGLNQGLDTAVVCVGNQSHWVAGEGYLVLLERVAGRWTVRDQHMTWIS